IVASIVVNNNIINPIIVNTIDNVKTVFNEIFPVTVGRLFVLSITVSISTSYQLLKTSAPAITNKLPTVVNKNKSIFSTKDTSLKYSANQNPVMTGKTLNINTGPLNSNFTSEKIVDFC